MNIDSINDDNVPFNRAITDTMKILADYLKDPLANVLINLFFMLQTNTNSAKNFLNFQINPFKLKDKKRFKISNKILREAGREKILERIQMLQNQDSNLPNDVLTRILKSYGLQINFQNVKFFLIKIIIQMVKNSIQKQ